MPCKGVRSPVGLPCTDTSYTRTSRCRTNVEKVEVDIARDVSAKALADKVYITTSDMDP